MAVSIDWNAYFKKFGELLRRLEFRQNQINETEFDARTVHRDASAEAEAARYLASYAKRAGQADGFD